jgi:hypothetical protein
MEHPSNGRGALRDEAATPEEYLQAQALEGPDNRTEQKASVLESHLFLKEREMDLSRTARSLKTTSSAISSPRKMLAHQRWLKYLSYEHALCMQKKNGTSQ